MGNNSKNIKFSVFNIKLQSDKRSGEAAYRELFKHLYEIDPRINTFGEKYTEIRSLFVTEDANVIYGTLLNYTVIDPEKWFDKKADQKTRVELPEDKYPNFKLWEYFFIPSLHRFCIYDKSGVSKKQIGEFLEKGLTKVLNKNEEVKINIEVSSDAIERIIHADQLTYLKVNLSYSNNDLTSDYNKLIDDDLRESNVGEFEVEAKNKNKKNIDLEQSKLLKGYLKLSQSNGYAEATIVENRRRVKVKTKNHPLTLNVHVKGDNITTAIFNELKNRFGKINVRRNKEK